MSKVHTQTREENDSPAMAQAHVNLLRQNSRGGDLKPLLGNGEMLTALNADVAAIEADSARIEEARRNFDDNKTLLASVYPQAGTAQVRHSRLQPKTHDRAGKDYGRSGAATDDDIAHVQATVDMMRAKAAMMGVAELTPLRGSGELMSDLAQDARAIKSDPERLARARADFEANTAVIGRVAGKGK